VYLAPSSRGACPNPCLVTETCLSTAKVSLPRRRSRRHQYTNEQPQVQTPHPLIVFALLLLDEELVLCACSMEKSTLTTNTPGSAKDPLLLWPPHAVGMSDGVTHVYRAGLEHEPDNKLTDRESICTRAQEVKLNEETDVCRETPKWWSIVHDFCRCEAPWHTHLNGLHHRSNSHDMTEAVDV